MKRISFLMALLGLTLMYSCQKEKSFEVPGPTSPGSGGTAVFALQGTGGNCMNANIAGSYVSGTAVTASNTVTIDVNVTTAGSYTIHTATVNGFYFTGSGNFTATGLQTITLNASGTPSAQGSQVFTVVAGSSTCTFAVNVDAAGTGGGGGGGGGDHFPLTANSWWSYEDASSPGDSIVRTNVAAVTIAGNSYRAFEEKDDAGIIDSVFFRKSGSAYYEYTWADNYSILTFDNEVLGDLLFLKEGVAAGTTWNSSEFTGTVSGQNAKLRYAYTCVNPNTSVTVNGQNFSNTAIIKFKSQISMMGSPFTDEGVEWTMYYAQGIGLVYTKATVNGTTQYEVNIRHWHVL